MAAKIARVEAYLFDPYSDYYNLSKELERVVEKTDMYMIEMNYAEKKFKWDDDLVINKLDCTKEEVAKFFRELPEFKEEE